jgi:N-methylhydantoinase B
VRNTPIELQEIKYPFLIEQHALREDSGGAGRYRGGLGIAITYRCLQRCKANINLERTGDPPWGLNGGGQGAVNVARITRSNGDTFTVFKQTEIELEKDDRVTFLTAGGGGYGDPHERDDDAIARDLSEGVTTPEGVRAFR